MITCRIGIVGLILGMIGCSQNADSQSPALTGGTGESRPVVATEQFREYWNQGTGELTRYALEQARYGEIHHGDAVLIFVTEDFLTDKEVKLESEPAGRNVTPLLKLNFVKKFVTGIYPYSLMTSVFSPIDVYADPHALKVSASTQEWCGQVYTQLNLRGKAYEVESHSYFEREADEKFSLDTVLLEDEVWTRIRLAPGTLPVGELSIVPGTLSSRLRHKRLEVDRAVATLESIGPDSSGSDISRYTLSYGNGERSLAIDFRTAFPHEITGWTETYSDFGKVLTTRAVRTNSIMLDYWKRHTNADSVLREQLGLDPSR